MTGAKVVMDNFDSNEQMYIKVANGDAYDVLVPSDYMIQRMNIQFLISGVLLVSYTIRQKYLKKIWKKMDGIFS